MDRWDDEREVVFEDEPPVLPDQAYPDQAYPDSGLAGAGRGGDDDRLLGERPPHWE